MEFEAVMQELESLSKEMMKKRYLSNGAKEPLYGVATGAMKPMKKIIKKDQALAEQLYETGNYDAMYFAGVIADPDAMTEADYDRWMDGAYFFMVSDFVVAVTLAEAKIGEKVARKWIDSDEELRRSAGWSCYCWMMGYRKDETFDIDVMRTLLERAEDEIKDAPVRTAMSINNFIYTTGVSYLPLHDEAVAAAKRI